MNRQQRAARLRGLYVITDPLYCAGQLLAKVEAAIKGGAQIIQYRNKTDDRKTQQRQAQALAKLCKQHQRIFLLNDDVELALDVNADGVHMGQADLGGQDIAHVRHQLGMNKILGITCHQDLTLAQAAQQQGANYVAFGRFFTSQTKPAAPGATIDILAAAKRQLDIPVVAIGGITTNNAPALLAAGADMLAVIHAVFAPDFNPDDVEHAAHRLSELFNQAQ